MARDKLNENKNSSNLKMKTLQNNAWTVATHLTNL